jgi:hypothetical protein
MLAILPASSQVSVRDSSISMVLIVPTYGFQTPGGDLAKRFGNNSNIGLNIIYKNKSKWYFSAEGNFLFGNKVKEPNLYSNLTTDKGYIIGSDGLYAIINTFERGYYMSVSAGRLFPTNKPNPNTGFFVQAGAGFIQHKIFVQDKKNAVPALQGDYKKGYDHLTNGFMLKQMAGYWYTGNSRLINFFGAVEFVQGFTKSRRDYNFNDMAPEKNSRIDLLLGFRVGWMMPLYKEAPAKFYTF